MRNGSNTILRVALLGLLAGLAMPHAALGQCETWQPFVSGGNIGVSGSSINAVTVYNGEMIIGGNFTTIGGQTFNRIARWDGSNWQPLGQGVNNAVNTLTVYNGELIAGGVFTTAGGLPANFIARWNGSNWFPVGILGVSNTVTCLTVYNGELIAGGLFGTAGGSPASRIARWNGTSWNNLGTGLTGPGSICSALTTYNGELMVGGLFSGAGAVPAASIAKWNGANWLALGSGMNNQVEALTVHGGNLIAGGFFTTAGGVTANSVARWNGANWAAMGTGMNGGVNALAVQDLRLIAGGEFTTADGPIANRIAFWNGASWQAMSTGMTGPGSPRVNSMTVHNGDLIAGGMFNSAGGTLVNNIARWVGPRWASAASGVFSVATNWSSGAPPGPTCSVQFGLTPSNTAYTVTFAGHATSSLCSVRNQRPTFDLGGFQYSVMDEVRVGLEESARLHLTYGSLISPLISVGPYGTLSSDAPVTGNIVNHGKIKPGRLIAGGSGEFVLNGNFTQEPGAVLEIEFDDTTNGLLTVNGNVTLDGAIRMVVLLNGNIPDNQTYSVLTATGTMSGTFSGALLPFLGPDKVVSLEYIGGAPAMNDGSGETNMGGPDASEAGGGGINITITSPNGSPDPDDPQNVALDGEPTGIAGLFVGGSPLQLGPAESDLALSIKDADPEANGSAVVLLNDGGGASFTPVIIEVGNQPSGVVTAALADGAELDDLAVTNQGDNNVTILFHDGSNVYTSVNVAVGNEPSAIAAGDLDGDLLTDLAVTNLTDNTVTILINNGDRTFTAQSPIAVGGQPMSVAVAVIVGGTLPDIVVANSSSDTITILGNQGGLTFDPVIVEVGDKPIIVTPTDIDNDRDLDLAVSNNDAGTVGIVKNLGGGVLSSPVFLPVDGAPGSMDAWDMDKDGDEDLAVVVLDDTLGEPIVRILRNDSTTSIIAYTLFDPLGSGEDPKLVIGSDVSGDSLGDLVTVNVTGTPLNGPDGFAAGPSKSSMSIRRMLPRPVCRADLAPVGNLDGNVGVPDLLFIINAWGPCLYPNNCPADIAPEGPPIGDDVVGVPDLLYIINNWGPCQP